VSKHKFTRSNAPSPSSRWPTPTSTYSEGEPAPDLFNANLFGISRALPQANWEVTSPFHTHPHTPVEFPPLPSQNNPFGLDPPPTSTYQINFNMSTSQGQGEGTPQAPTDREMLDCVLGLSNAITEYMKRQQERDNEQERKEEEKEQSWGSCNPFNKPKEIGIKPNPFLGGYDFYTFLEKFEAYLMVNSQVYVTDSEKVILLLGLCEGGAASWTSLWYTQLAHAREGIREAGPVTYHEVMLSFKGAFGGFDAQKDAREQLKSLQQGTTTTCNFGMAFLVLGQQSGFSDKDLKERYLDAMNPKLRRIIMGWDRKKDTLNQIITMAHDAEMNLYKDAKRSNRHYWYNNNPTQATGLDPNAMDISASVLGSKPSFIKKPQNQTGTPNSVAQPLAATQNNQQQGSALTTQQSGQNLNGQNKNPFRQVPTCHNCGKPGHIAVYCRAPKKQDGNDPFAHIRASAVPSAFQPMTNPGMGSTSSTTVAASVPSAGPTLSNHELMARLEEAEEALARAKDKFGTDF
jgi:hypothetical protein